MFYYIVNILIYIYMVFGWELVHNNIKLITLSAPYSAQVVPQPKTPYGTLKYIGF